ncbi:MAG: type IX secretion system membrane protein PorP/SprF [Saprospiraceae bacterium]
MREKKYITALFLGLFFLNNVYAQQDPHFTKFMFRNQSLYNPAVTGRLADYHASLVYRLQWIGIEGAPSTMAGNFEKSLDEGKAGLGFNFYYDKIGFDQNMALQVNYAYRVIMGDKSVLSMGIKGGTNLINADFSNAVTPELVDPLHTRNNIWIPRVGLGIMYNTKDFYISFSVPSLMAYVPKNDVQIMDKGGFFSHHFFSSMGYVIRLKDDEFQIKPFVFAKYHPSAPLQVDIGLQLWYKNVFSVGGSYRTGDALAAMVEIPVLEGLHMSYAYDYTNSLFRKIGSGAHEIVLEYTWDKKKTKVPSIHKISNLPKF